MLANMRTWWEPSHISDAEQDQKAAASSCQSKSAGGWGASVYSLGRRATAAVATVVAAAATVASASDAGGGGSGADTQKVPPPWSGLGAGARDQVLALGSSEGRDILLRGPPSASSCPGFRFNLEAALPVASAALEADDGLRRLRFELVPRLLSEEHFWRNYFYRVYLIKRSAQISALATVTKQPEPLHQQQEDNGLVRSGLHISQSAHVVATASSSPMSSSSSCDSFERVDDASPIGNVDVDDDFDDVGIDAEWERELQLELAGIELATSSSHRLNGGGAN